MYKYHVGGLLMLFIDHGVTLYLQFLDLNSPHDSSSAAPRWCILILSGALRYPLLSLAIHIARSDLCLIHLSFHHLPSTRSLLPPTPRVHQAVRLLPRRPRSPCPRPCPGRLRRHRHIDLPRLPSRPHRNPTASPEATTQRETRRHHRERSRPRRR